MMVYVAGRTTDLDRVKEVAGRLEDEGHVITFKWYGPDGEIRTDLKPEDLEIETWRAGVGAGFVGQPSTAIKITHKPTGEEATAQGTSLLMCREEALNDLRRRLNAGWRAKPEIARELALRERQACWDCDITVLVLQHDILGAAIEFGMVVGDEKPGIVLIPDEDYRDSVFWYLPGVHLARTIDEVVDLAREEDDDAIAVAEMAD